MSERGSVGMFALSPSLDLEEESGGIPKMRMNEFRYVEMGGVSESVYFRTAISLFLNFDSSGCNVVLRNLSELLYLV